MNKTIICVALFCFFQAINAGLMKNVLNNIPNKFERQFDNKCKTSGLTCKNCETLMYCVEIDAGVYEENIVQTCKTPTETCLLNRCALEPNPKCPVHGGNKFICTGTGVFPDPYDCSSYHVCIEKDNIITDDDVPVNDLYAAVKCPENWGYNPVSTYCDVKLDDGFCPNDPPLPACSKIGDIGAVDGTSIYYICTTDSNGITRPILHMCPHGNVIDAEGTCQSKTNPETSSVQPATTQSTTAQPATTKATTIHTDPTTPTIPTTPSTPSAATV